MIDALAALPDAFKHKKHHQRRRRSLGESGGTGWTEETTMNKICTIGLIALLVTPIAARADSLAEQLAKAAQDLQPQLPIKMNNSTTLVGVMAGTREFYYMYTVDTIITTDLNQFSFILKKLQKEIACKSP